VKDQSHKDEMSAAIRGDFQRLRERGVPVALAPQEERLPDEEPPADESPQTPPEDAAAARRTWRSRLAGR
jgi:hypothetical protein